MPFESRILDALDKWRDLPAYQLERRADVFFAIFLPSFLSQRHGIKVREELIPEFPLHLRTIWPDKPRDKDDSCKVDYVALSDNLRKAYFIELKTDPRSRGDEQASNMEAAKRAGFGALLAGLLKIVKASADKHKYCCLLRLLAQHGLLSIPDELESALASRRYNSAVNACLPSVKLTDARPQIIISYLEPRAHVADDIGFDEFAAWLETLRDDLLALRFSQSLRRWAATQAGRSGK